MIDFSTIDIYRDKGLRDYQIENKSKIYNFWNKGRCVMLQMPTGTGKTRVFASIARDMHELGIENKKAVRILFLAHRKELIDQISETLSRDYSLANGIIAAGFHEQHHLPIQVGSVPTLTRRIDKWIDKNFDIIIIDEAHHTPADSYKKILKEFSNSKILGVTATPYRLSGVGFQNIFEDIIISNSVSEFIDLKWLSEYEYYSIKPTSRAQKEIDTLKLGFDGDYLESDMENQLDKDHIRANIIDTYLKYAKGKKGLVYSINQQHNIHLCEQFEKNGISAKAIDSRTSKKERQQIVRDFKNGKFDVLCNVNIFSEGFDCPDVEFIQLARPTKSLSMYLQQVGRGLRTNEGKEKVIFLDNVGLYNRFGLPSANRHWRYHFEGKADSEITSAISSPDSNKVIFMTEIEEGDEKIELIHASQNEIINSNIDTTIENYINNSNMKNYESDFKCYLHSQYVDHDIIYYYALFIRQYADPIIIGDVDNNHRSIYYIDNVARLKQLHQILQRNGKFNRLGTKRRNYTSEALLNYINFIQSINTTKSSEVETPPEPTILSDNNKESEIKTNVRSLDEVIQEIEILTRYNAIIPECLKEERETLEKQKYMTETLPSKIEKQLLSLFEDIEDDINIELSYSKSKGLTVNCQSK